MVLGEREGGKTLVCRVMFIRTSLLNSGSTDGRSVQRLMGGGITTFRQEESLRRKKGKKGRGW